MHYTLNQLRIFLSVAQLESVTKAAEHLHLTQPAVSIQLKNLQDQFEIPLTEVVGRKIYITEFGREIAMAAENILNQVYAINYKTLAYKGQLSGRLKISVVSTGKYVMPYFLSSFLEQHSGIDLVMDVTNKAQVLEILEKNEVDLALVSVIPDNLRVEKFDLLENTLYLVCNEKLKKTSADRSIHSLSELPFIFREEGSGTRQTMELFFQKYGIHPSKKLELTSNEAVKQALMAGLGYSILPLIGIRNELKLGQLHIIPTARLPIKTTWSLIWMKGKNHSPAAGAFLEHLKKEKTRIVSDRFSWTDEFHSPPSKQTKKG